MSTRLHPCDTSRRVVKAEQIQKGSTWVSMTDMKQSVKTHHKGLCLAIQIQAGVCASMEKVSEHPYNITKQSTFKRDRSRIEQGEETYSCKWGKYRHEYYGRLLLA